MFLYIEKMREGDSIDTKIVDLKVSDSENSIKSYLLNKLETFYDDGYTLVFSDNEKMSIGLLNRNTNKTLFCHISLIDGFSLNDITLKN